MENALLFRFGGLGDLLVALPAIRLLRLSFPSARLTLCCRGTHGALLRETGVVDRIIPEDSPLLLPLFAGEPEAAGRTIVNALNRMSSREAKRRGDLEEFDLVMGWIQGEKPGALKQTLGAAGLRAQILFIHAPTAGRERLSRYFFRMTNDALAASNLISFDECARLPLTSEIKAGGYALWGDKKPKGGFVVVHPGSGSETKRWPSARFMAIVERLSRKSVSGALVTGEAEERWAAELDTTPLPPGWIRLHRPDLVSLAGLVAEASLYVGNDSGVTHLAAACGAQVVALFRNDLADAWRPYGKVHLHQGSQLQDIGVDSVWKTVSSLLRL